MVNRFQCGTTSANPIVRVLVLGNGAAGAEKQALALGNKLRHHLKTRMHCLPVDCVRVTLGTARGIPPVLQVFGARITRNPVFGYKQQESTRSLLALDQDPHTFNVVIGCGRSTVALGVMMKQVAPTTTFNVQIQHPRVPLSWFDAVVVPRHDDLRTRDGATNLFCTSGTIHAVTRDLLMHHGCKWTKELDEKLYGRQTRVVWLVGGPCRGFRFTELDAEHMVEELGRALPRDDYDEVAVLVTFSRRTPETVKKVICRGLYARLPLRGQVLVWDGTERRNPYYALLATASCIVTTPDSISMTTEAIAAGKPVFTLGAATCKGKFLGFHEYMFKLKATAPFIADDVAASLRCKVDEEDSASSRARAMFENETSEIVDSIAKRIDDALRRTRT
uniref:Mitochondrial fission ELM1-like protein n=1 Tax=Hyaloperonospora arabidopsidis (strain Emoy2) TaxID=559515 RepID=M4B4V5_HYAAE